MPLLRLDRIIAGSGLSSRREVKRLLREGRVLVNGEVARDAAAKYDAATALILVDGERLVYSEFVYLMMNKPAGFVCAAEDRRERTVFELLDEQMRGRGLFTVGRLDKDTEGLLLLTDDGGFAHRVISPKSGIIKRYFARVDGVPTGEDSEKMRAGLRLADGTVCLPAGLEPAPGGGENECIVSVCEGKYHQVKRMMASLGKPVIYLKRISTGGLELDAGLAPSEWRELENGELEQIFSR